MCLALLAAPGFLKVNLLCEQIWFYEENGDLKVREIYDVFFSPLKPGCTSLLALSPHVLFDDEESLQIVTNFCTGDGEKAIDTYYEIQGAVSYTEGKLFVRLDKGGEESWGGEVLSPDVRFPARILQEDESLGLMSDGIGTLFELSFSNELKPGECYFVRLTVTPRRLLNLPDRFAVPDPIDGEDGLWWGQEIIVLSPQAVYQNFREMLQVAIQCNAGSDAAKAFRDLLETPIVNCCQIDLHRIVLVGPHSGDIERGQRDGKIQDAGTTTIALNENKHVVRQWEGGAQLHDYWEDYPHLVAHAIVEYLAKWGGLGKTKEDITTAVGGSHENCAIITDSLVRHRLAQEIVPPGGRYKADESGLQASEPFFRIASDRFVIAGFKPKGYIITSTLRYPTEAALAKRQQLKQIMQTIEDLKELIRKLEESEKDKE